MANRERGEGDITIGDKTYTMVLGTNAGCSIEDLMSTPLRRMSFKEVFILAMKTQEFRATRALFWGALRQHHGEVTLEQAGALIDKAAADGSSFAEKLASLVFATVPAEEDLKALGLKAGNDRPPKARRRRRSGTGTVSTSTRGTLD